MTFGLMMLAVSGGEPFITLSNFNAVSDVINPVDATCQYELTNGGDVRATQINNTVNDVSDWIVPKTLMSNYEAHLHVNSGTNPTGAALDTWLNLGTTRNWQLIETSIGSLSNNCTVQIRNATTLAVKASATVTMTATVST